MLCFLRKQSVVSSSRGYALVFMHSDNFEIISCCSKCRKRVTEIFKFHSPVVRWLERRLFNRQLKRKGEANAPELLYWEILMWTRIVFWLKAQISEVPFQIKCWMLIVWVVKRIDPMKNIHNFDGIMRAGCNKKPSKMCATTVCRLTLSPIVKGLNGCEWTANTEQTPNWRMPWTLYCVRLCVCIFHPLCMHTHFVCLSTCTYGPPLNFVNSNEINK